jgi:hypothetical protein
MARRIEHRTTTAWSPETVYTTRVDPAYLRERLAKLGGQGAQLAEHEVNGDAVRYRLRHGVAAENIPPAVRALVGGDLTIDRVETWSPGDGGYTGTVRVTIPGMPGDMSGTQRIAAAGGGSEYAINGEVSVPIPLFGGKIEETVAAQIGKLLDAEDEFTSGWLRDRD